MAHFSIIRGGTLFSYNLHIKSVKEDLATWTNNLKTKIGENIDCLALKKISTDENIKSQRNDINSIIEEEKESKIRHSHEIETANVGFKLDLSKIYSAYSKKLSEIVNLDPIVCEELLRGLNSRHLFGFINALVEKQIIFEEQQDIKQTMIRNAVLHNQYDVFISCKSEDYIYATDVYDFLVSIGKHPFLAYKSIDEVHYDEYNILIRETIDVCQDMIVLLSNPSYANTPYVSFEWNLFVNEKAAGRKARNLIPIIRNLYDVPLLPIALRQCQACTNSNYKVNLPKYLLSGKAE